LKLKYDILLSNFAFKFDVRRYTLANARRGMKSAGALLGDGDGVPEPMLRELAGRIGAGQGSY